MPLYKIMACICAVQKRAERTEASFGPLHDMVRRFSLAMSASVPFVNKYSIQTLSAVWYTPVHVRAQVALLVRYNISTDEDVLRKLDEAPNAWKALCKKKLLRCALCPLD